MLKPSHAIFGHIQHQCWIFLLCSKIDFVFLKSNPYGCELEYHTFFLWNPEVNWTKLASSIDIWIGPSLGGWLEKTLKNKFVPWPFQSFWFFLKVGNFVIICYVDDKWATTKKMGYFFSKMRWRPSPSKLEGPHNVTLKDFPSFMEKATSVLVFFPNSSCQVVHNRHLVLRKQTPPKLGIIHMWK